MSDDKNKTAQIHLKENYIPTTKPIIVDGNHTPTTSPQKRPDTKLINRPKPSGR